MSFFPSAKPNGVLAAESMVVGPTGRPSSPTRKVSILLVLFSVTMSVPPSWLNWICAGLVELALSGLVDLASGASFPWRLKEKPAMLSVLPALPPAFRT
ncbi:MAG: hypothetical protein ACREYF_05800 [Gammaproteobacteria bacterium]